MAGARERLGVATAQAMAGDHVPFDGSCFDGKEWLTDKICTHYLCVRGLQSVMGLGKY